MIAQYFRPSSLQEALDLLKGNDRIPLAGGSYISSSLTKEPKTYDVVDLQDLHLDKITFSAEKITIGATTTLQTLIDLHRFSDQFTTSILLEAPLNIRNRVSLGGLLRTCSGKSPFVTILIALNANIILEPGTRTMPILDFISFRDQYFPGSLITKVLFQLDQQVSFQYISRTNADFPILCVALSMKGVHRFRQALGGFGNTALLTVDGNADDDFAHAASSACANVSKTWASHEYLSSMAEVLSIRCQKSLEPVVSN